MTTFPIRVCVALTIHKAQGMTIGEGELFNKVVIYFPNPTNKLVPGLMLVAFSRAKNASDFAVGNVKSQLNQATIKNTGKGKPYEKRRDFLVKLQVRSPESMEVTMERIKAIDPSVGNKTYEGGCEFLLEWYRNKVNSDHTNDGDMESQLHDQVVMDNNELGEFV